MGKKGVVIERRCVLTPVKGCPFASEMVLNPAIIKDPERDIIHMLVRTSGPWEQKRLEGKPLPYPIFLAYGCSLDGGKSFEFDFSTPALASNSISKLFTPLYNGK